MVARPGKVSWLRTRKGIFYEHPTARRSQQRFRTNQEWYQHANMALDAISLGGATAAGLVTVKGIKMLLSSGITPMQALKGLNRQQRKRLSREIARSNYPGISSKTIKVMESAGQLEKRYSNAAIRGTTLRQIKESIGIGLSFGGSALGGNVRKLAIAVVAGDE